ncbi:MAG: hypothetical protein AB7G11_16640 [Phycisphaerales bacterium]
MGRLSAWKRSAEIACTIAAAICVTGCGTGPAQTKPAGAASGVFAFWPPFPDEPHVQFLRSFRSSADVAASKESGLDRLVFGEESKDEKGLAKPYGVTMHDGAIYVCDMRSSSLTVLDIKKKQTRLVGVSGVTRLKHPVDVAVAEDGTIYVADNDQGAVLVYDRNERYAMAIGHPKFKPVSVDTYKDRLYVCDMAGQVVEVYDRASGKQIGSIGSVGDEDGQFRLPLGVAVDAKGDVFVTDMMRCRVQKFSPDGKLISAMGQLGDFAGSFARPKHLAVDEAGVLYVVDSAFQNVQMFDDQNRLLMHFGSAGSHPGAMDLPVGICVDRASVAAFGDLIHPGFEAYAIVAVTNQFGGSKVSVYAVGKRREGYALADLSARAAKVDLGVGAKDDQLKLQTVGEEEPVPEGPGPAESPASPGAPGGKPGN